MAENSESSIRGRRDHVEHFGFPPYAPQNMHHVTYLLYREGGKLDLLKELLALRLLFLHPFRGFPFFRRKVVHLTLQLMQPLRILDDVLHCGNQTLM